jgi:hypothetical protein
MLDALVGTYPEEATASTLICTVPCILLSNRPKYFQLCKTIEDCSMLTFICAPLEIPIMSNAKGPVLLLRMIEGTSNATNN